MSLNQLFYPQTMAVVWACQDKNKIGSKVFNNIIDNNYQGTLFPVNNNGIEKIDEYKVYESLSNIPIEVDLVVIVIPAKFVLNVLLDCVASNIKNVIVISAGFKEIGKKGIVLEKEIRQIAQINNINLLGPNCLGLINTNQKLNASFAAQYPKTGDVSFISQSGALGTASLGWALSNNLGLSKFVSLWNEAVLDEAAVLEYLFQDKDTKVIMAYLEQISDGSKLKKVLEKNKDNKPVIVFKSGTSKQGQVAASSHTGALGSDDNLFSVFCQKYNIIRVDSVELMFNLARTFSLLTNKDQDLRKVTIITNAGWFGVITTDYLEESGIELSEISEDIKNSITKQLGPNISVNNPIDLVGDADSSRYEVVLKEIIEKQNNAVILVLLTKQENTDDLNVAKVINKFSQKTDKAIISCFIGGEELKESKEYLQKQGLSIFNFPEKMIEVLAKINSFNDFENYKIELRPQEFENSNCLKKGEMLNEISAYGFLEKYNLPIAKYKLLRKGKLKKDLLAELNFPLVLKVMDENLLHKSDEGAVIVNLKNEEELQRAIIWLPKKFLDKDLLIQEMKKGGEFILGIKKDPQFGHLLLIGYGGTYVEVYKDLLWLLFPFSKKEFLKKLKKLKAYAIIKGARWGEVLNENALAELALKIQAIVLNNPNIIEIDFNPVILDWEKVWVCDGVIKT